MLSIIRTLYHFKFSPMRYLSLLILLCFSTCLSAQLVSDVSFLEHATEIVTESGEIEIKDTEEALYSVKRRVTVLDEQSEANLFYVYYDDDSKLLRMDADIYDLSGKPIRKVKKSEIRDVSAVGGSTMYSDWRVRYIELNYPTYPYVVEFSYSKKLKGISFATFPNWHFQNSYSSAVKESSFSLTIPNNLDFQYKMYNQSLEPTIKKNASSTTYHWTLNNLPAIKREPYSPPAHATLPILRLTPAEFTIDEYKGSMRTWKDYGQFLHTLWNGRDELPAALAENVQTIAAAHVSPTDKVAALYKFMQENKRYVSVQLGIGGWQPLDANYVETNDYGDCKALSNYMKAMLSEVGIKSYPVIVEAGGDLPYIAEDDFVDPDFNHAILYIPEEDIWLECTSRDNPAGYLGSFTHNRRVLLVTPEGGKLAYTPKLTATDNISTEVATLALNNDGGAHIEYSGQFTGIAHEKWRGRLNYLTEEELENRVREHGALPNLSFHKLDIQAAIDTPESSVDFVADIPRYAAKAGKRLFVPLNKICPRKYSPSAVEERKQPLSIASAYTKRADITFKLPEGFRIESLPKAIEIDTEFGHYSLSLTEVENGVQIKREMIMNDGQLSADAYTDFRQFCLDIVKADGAKMVLVSE